jgi:hypothetical protein
MPGRNPFEEVTAAIQDHMATWDPQSPQEILDGFEGLAEIADTFCAALHDLRATLGRRDATSGMADALGIMAGMIRPVQNLAEEAAGNFREENKFWLEGR